MDLVARWNSHAEHFTKLHSKMIQEKAMKQTLVITADHKGEPMDTTGDTKSPRSLDMPSTATQLAVVDGKTIPVSARPWPDLEIKIPARTPMTPISPMLQSTTPTPVHADSAATDYKTMSISDAEPTTKFSSSVDKELPQAKRLKVSPKSDDDWHEMSINDFSEEVKEEKH